MNIEPMTSERSGRPVANQNIIHDDFGNTFFQSYQTIIAKKNFDYITLDKNYWDYSVTTGKYRNQFLGECIADTRKKIKAGLYKLADLNGSNNVIEEDLKSQYFQKWKDEEVQKEQQFRNERLAERQRLNGGYSKAGH